MNRPQDEGSRVIVEKSSSSTHPLAPPTQEEVLVAWLRLIRSRRVGPGTFYRLMAEHGDAGAALAALPAIARAAGVSDYTPCPHATAEAEIARGRAAGARLVAIGAADYPPALAGIADAPPLLWMRGAADRATQRAVALVGARNASSLGLRMARTLARGLGGAGISILSGLARGIDTAAHEAALETGTIAVLAGGIDVIYPAENADLTARIAETGALISEQPPGLVPQARHFPRRNRIISGAAHAVVVVEAAARSGSLITARSALDQGREVLAVPGHPFDARAAGCNMLIRDGARLVRGAEDVIEALSAAGLGGGQPSHGADKTLSAPEEAVARRASAAARQGPDAPLPGKAPIKPSARGGGAESVSKPAAAAPADRRAKPARHPRAPSPTTAGGGRGGHGDGALASAAPHRRPEADDLANMILARLGAAPVAEDQLLRDIGLATAAVLPALVTLELEGAIRRHPGGLISRETAHAPGHTAMAGG